jgi:NNP family nitrate/nitrite transporter-like MFS transporter
VRPWNKQFSIEESFTMANTKAFLQSGHPGTLFASFLYFDFTFAVWVLNGAMGPFITEQFHLSPAQVGLMVSLPTLSGAFMRFPLGVLSQYIGRKSAAIVEMSCILIALLYGFFFVHTFSNVLAMGVLLGTAGASFGVALSLGSGWFPKEYKGLAMGIAGAGNSGTALAAFFAPRLAKLYGWEHVYGIAALFMLLPLIVMIVFAKEPPDLEHRSLGQHLSIFLKADSWSFNLIYIITFGGFLGLATFLPSLYVSQFHIAKSQAGTLTMCATLLGSMTRVVGGWFSDRVGGINTLYVVFLIVIGSLLGLATSPTLAVTTVLFMVAFAALGAGNGATFQLVPMRWPLATAIAGSMVGEIGALGGGILPNVLGQSKQHTGSFGLGFACYAGLATAVLVMLAVVSRTWTRTWVGAGGRALSIAQADQELVVTGEGLLTTP